MNIDDFFFKFAIKRLTRRVLLCLRRGNEVKLNPMLSGTERTLPGLRSGLPKLRRRRYTSLGLGALVLLVFGVVATRASGQTLSGKPAALTHTEPGLENAVRWKWRVAPSDDKDWGLAVPTPTPLPSPALAAATPTPENRPALYEVKHGDALILIGKKFGLTVEQIKAFNGLKNDMIRVGQMLKIPTLAELAKATPSPNPSATPSPNPRANPRTKKRKPPESPESRIGSETGVEPDKLRLQIFLDREQFSGGPIAANPDPFFSKILILYQSTHEDAKDDPSLGAKARAAVGDVFAHYKLRAEDFRFIAPPKAETVEPKKTPITSHLRPGKRLLKSPAITPAHPTYEQLSAMPMLAYRTPWEFVAERFHCQESFLHTLNYKLPAQPGIGAEFLVPNVIPFEIEKAFDEPLQPQADPKNPTTASVIGLSQLNIYQGGALIAVFPMSPARPGLHGRGSWTILDAIPHPRLATFQEERPELTRKAAPAGATPEPTSSPANTMLSSEQYLAAGPRNPVGILWINLAKSNSTEPLPYGLHGTSIPDQMNNEQSIGGFRLTNWDIARAVRHLPSGTPLEWK
jgi:LysM repeat protein